MVLQTQEQKASAQRAATRLGITIPETVNSAQLNAVNTTPKITSPAPQTANAGLQGAVQSANDQTAQMVQERKKEAQANKDKTLSDYTARLFETPTKSEIMSQQYDAQGVDTAQKQLDDINSQIQVEQFALEREKQRIQDNAVGASMGQVQNMMNEAERKSLRKQADLSIIQLGIQGKFNTAKAIADRAVDAAMEREKNIIEALKINYEDNKALFTTAEQREFDMLLSDRERTYNEERDSKKQISDYSIEAMKYGADGGIITSIRNANTPEEAQAIAANFIGPAIQRQQALDEEAKRASIAAANRANRITQKSSEAPTINTINGVDMQWNPETGKWENVATAAQVDTKKSLDQITFLKQTADEAKKLSGASGPSGVSKWIGDTLVGDTEFRQLEAYTNTLRTNILTLNTDPAVKKFFGPQMSNADVRLMTAAGTTLNPEQQTPEQMKIEIERLQELFNRMEKAVTDGTTATPEQKALRDKYNY